MFAALVVIGMISQYITQWVAWKMDRKMYKLLRQDLFTAQILKTPEEFRKKALTQKTAPFRKMGSYTTKTLDLLKGYPNVCRDTCGPIAARHKKSLDEMEDARYDYGKFKTFTNVLNGSVMFQSMIFPANL